MSDDQRGSGAEGNPPGGQPNPFSREGSDGDDAFASRPPTPAPDQPAPAAPADQVAEPPTAPANWPTYPPTDAQPTGPAPGTGQTPYPTTPYPTTPYLDPYGPPANPVGQQPPPPSFDPQPTGPYGAPDPGQGYPPPPTAPYSPAPNYGSNPYEVNPYQPSYGGGYSPYGVPAGPHPKANTALIFGIVGLVLALSCGVGGLVGIGGIVNGRAAKAEIDADPQRFTGRSTASAGFGLGVAAVVVAGVVMIIFFIALASGALDS